MTMAHSATTNPPCPLLAKAGTAQAKTVVGAVTTMAGISRSEHTSEHFRTLSANSRASIAARRQRQSSLQQ